LTILLLQVYPESRTESTLLLANMLEEERARKDDGDHSEKGIVVVIVSAALP